MTRKIAIKKTQIIHSYETKEYTIYRYPIWIRFLKWLFADEWEQYIEDKMEQDSNICIRGIEKSLSEMALDKLGYEVISNVKAKIRREGDLPDAPFDSFYSVKKKSSELPPTPKEREVK